MEIDNKAVYNLPSLTADNGVVPGTAVTEYDVTDDLGRPWRVTWSSASSSVQVSPMNSTDWYLTVYPDGETTGVWPEHTDMQPAIDVGRYIMEQGR